ncbi:hypothetical protein [Dinoroseobacter sp. S124A]|uniref:hypothetical protein n=1 Tax=Dinoroseobacter sp. S124A TaxID=3415128 RepID=UPI003C7C0178
MSEIRLKNADKDVFCRLSSTGRISNALRQAMTQQYNRCNSCGEVAEAGRPMFAGYENANEPLVVCAKCSVRLKELATPVYWTDTYDLSVDENQRLWRYMDFSKFAAMMQQGGLHFTRASDFDDRFEAAARMASKEASWDNHYLEFFKEVVKTTPPGYPSANKTENEVVEEAERLLGDIKSAYARARDLLVSCWHMNHVESEALWRIYCTPGAPGVAIQTDVAKLWSALENEVGANVGRVQYIDFKKGFASGDQRIYCKRSSLAHECEVRAVLPNDREGPLGYRLVHSDLNELVESVVVSPFAPPWFLQVVKETVSRFGYEFHVKESEIAEVPFY